MTIAAPSANMVESTLTGTYTRGTDTVLAVTDGSIFPSPTPLKHVIMIRDTYSFTATTKWCLVKYVSRAANDLTMSAAADYALAVNLGGGAVAAEVFPIGSYVSLVNAADEIAHLFTEQADKIDADGSVPLTANWDAGPYSITALRFISDQATGTAPFTVASTTVVANLNASALGGNAASAFVKVDGSVPLTANWDVGAFDIRARNLTADALTAARVIFTGANGLLSTSANLAWNGTTFGLTGNVNMTGSITVAGSIEVGPQTGSDNNAILDFHAIGDTPGDFEARIIRLPGVNGLFAFYQTGTLGFFFSGGNVGIGTSAPGAKCHIDQSSTTGAIPVLTLDQADVSDGFINLVGTSAASATGPISTWHAGGAEIEGYYRIEINGAQKWAPYCADPTS